MKYADIFTGWIPVTKRICPDCEIREPEKYCMLCSECGVIRKYLSVSAVIRNQKEYYKEYYKKNKNRLPVDPFRKDATDDQRGQL